jgi:adenosylcobinamide-phosphate synthase
MTEAASGWGSAAPLVLLLIVLMADGLIGGLPVVRSILGLPLDVVRSLTRWFDRRLNRENRSPGARRMRGLFVVIVVAALAWAVAATLEYGVKRLAYGWIMEGLCILALLALRAAIDRMRRAARSLAANDGEAARAAVTPLVRYDVAGLDGFAVARAAVEGGSMQFVERLVGTIFWYLLLGLPGLFIYRANGAVADVIGRPSPRHAAFGFVPARLDDVLSLIPALASGPLLVMGALFVPGAAPAAALRAWIQDLAERSFKAGYRGEGALAGALGVALGGPRPFDGTAIPGKWIGDGRARATVGDIDRAVIVIVIACLLVGIGLAMGIVGSAG